MRLRTRLMLLTAVAAVGPIGILGLGATQVSAELMTETVTDSQARSADELASHVDLWLTMELRGLSQQVRAFRLDQLRDSDLVNFQRLIFQQASGANIVSIISQKGEDRAPSLFLTRPEQGRLANKEVVNQERFSAFRAALPLQRLSKLGTDDYQMLVGQPYKPPGRTGPVLPVIIPTDSGTELFLAVELAMDIISQRFENTSNTGIEVALLDGTGTPFIQHGGDAIEARRFKAFVGGTACADVRYSTAKAQGIVAACAPVSGTGWLAVVAEPVASITSAGDDIRNRTLYMACIAGAFAMLLGAGFSRSMSQHVARLKDAAFEVAEGSLGLRVAPDGPSEVRELALAFNFMSTRLARNRAEIEENREAIAAFNLELQRQLDEQMTELTETHRRLVESSRLAAVGEMGAGLAHELNNPLAGILGMIQLLRAKNETDNPMLAEVESQAQRCRHIVQQLLRFSRGTEAGGIEHQEWAVADLSEVLHEVIELVSGPFRESGVQVKAQVGRDLTVRCDVEAMRTALAQLLTSLRAACGRGGTVQILAQQRNADVVIRFAANAPNLDLDRDDWKAMGMGFWFAHQVISEHGGTMDEPGPNNASEDASWTIALPGA